jgi:hypothetical protein
MKNLLLLLVLSLFSVVAFAQTPQPLRNHRHSAVRLPGENVNGAIRRYVRRLSPYHLQQMQQGKSAVNSAVPLSQLNLKAVTQTYTQQELLEGFQKVRDTRFLNDPQHSGLKRRSSWLFPDDGCWARASLMSLNLEKMGRVRPAKVFAFGNLHVQTPNSPSGSVSWWYHVVPAVRVGQNVFVLDPAIEARAPITLKEWLVRMGGRQQQVPGQEMRVAICHAQTYTPGSACQDPSAEEERQSVADQTMYLPSEWSRLVELNRNPEKELGDFPPWLNPVRMPRRF